ncbi:MAG: serine/threonine-protein kinase [bacterium]
MSETPAERYSKVKRLALAARDLPVDRRRSFLESECAGDAELAAEVESLLAHDSDSPSVLEESGIGRMGVALSTALADTAMPEAVGPYRIVRELGRGGMGVVYEAEQEEPLRRTVALKLIKKGLDTERVVARFQSERQALARMNHPSIARVFDAGTEEGGRPYFVMELVRGQPITTYCDERAHSVRERLVLVLRVGEAVSHAHQRGIIHRDLKPSNVLVSDESGRPLPKVIDFGIAKAIDAEAGGTLTREVHVLGTPEYMSPEQAGVIESGVDTRTDVYSLGVLLYELLAGERPYRFEERTATALRAAFEGGLPDPPSTVVRRRGGAARTARKLAGDLDNIVLMAMRQEPDRRYASVDALIEDIRRHLDGRPVAARPDTWGYRARKFVSRHTTGVLAAAIVFALVVASAAALAVQGARVVRERDRALAAEARAEQEADAAKHVADFLSDLFSASNPDEAQGKDPSAREILQKGADRIPTLDVPLELRARLLRTLGVVQHSLGRFDAAESLFTQGLAIQEDSLKVEDAATASTLDGLATLRHDQGKYDESASLRRRALRIWAQNGDDNGEVALAKAYLAATLQAKGEKEEPRRLLEEALASLRRASGDEADVAWVLGQLGYLIAASDPAGAEQHFVEALALQQKLFPGDHPDVAGTLNNLGGLKLKQGDCAAAEKFLTRARDMCVKLYGRDHAAVGRACGMLARAYDCEGKIETATPLYREGLNIFRKVLGNKHPYTLTALADLGGAELRQGRVAVAEPLLRECLAGRLSVLPKGDPGILEVESRLEECLTKMGRSPGKDPLLARVAAAR